MKFCEYGPWPLNNISLEEWLALEPCVIYPRPVVDKEDLSDWDLDFDTTQI